MPFNRTSLALMWVTWSALVFLAPTTVGLRDSGEFLIAPVFLDIVHSPGFPAFSQMANLFTFIPAGSLPFRVHLFAALCTVALLAVVTALTHGLTRSIAPGGSRTTYRISAAVAVLTLAGTTPFWRNALSSEAYSLNCVLTGLALWMVVRSVETRDSRLIPLLGVLAGMGMGNHAVLAPLAVATLAILAFQRPPIRPLILGTAFALFSGLAVYGYLPVRALALPPLNTGSPDSVARVWNQLSNARDRALRPAANLGDDMGPNSLSMLFSDFSRLAADASLFASSLAFFGFLQLFLRNKFQAALLSNLLIVPLFFFGGWELEPWLPSSVALAVAAGIGAAALLARVPTSPRALYAVLSIATVAVASLPLKERFTSLSVRPSGLIEQQARSLLAPLPPGAVVVTEPSWFILRHVTAVSGYRDDTALLYQPSITFPEYFAPVRWNDALNTLPDIGDGPVGRMAAFVDYTSRFGVLFFEPTPLLVDSFHRILAISGAPLTSVQRGVSGSVAVDSAVRFADWIKKLRFSAHTDNSIFSSDIAQYSEVLGNNFAALFVALKRDTDANAIFEAICSPPLRCLPQSVNNHALVLIRLSQPCKAKNILELSIREHSRSVPGALFHNLTLADQACSRHASVGATREVLSG